MTNRPFGFRKRIQVTNEELLPPSSSKENEQPQSLATIELLRGRRTGLIIKPSNQRDEHGMERLSDFWTAEIAENVANNASDDTVCDDANEDHNSSISEPEGGKSDSSVLSKSLASDRSKKISIGSMGSSAGSQLDSSYQSDLSAVGQALLDATKSSHRSSSSSVISDIRLSTATGRSSVSNCNPDEENSMISNKESNLSHGDDESHADQETEASFISNKESILSHEDDEDEDQKSPADSQTKSLNLSVTPMCSSNGGKAQTPTSALEAAVSKYQSPDPDATKKLVFADPNSASPKNRKSTVLDTIVEPEADAESDAPAFDDNDSDDAEEEIRDETGQDIAKHIGSDCDISPENRPTTKKVRAKKVGTAGLGYLQAMGRASYCSTDSYAPKSSRLSMIAPRPNILPEENGIRQSSRRKIPPLQFWRNERVEYARATGAAVPEIVDLVVRSPEPTPTWVRRRREGKSGAVPADITDSPVGKESNDSKKVAPEKFKRARAQEAADPGPSGKRVKRVAHKKEPAPVAESEAVERAPGPKKVTPFFAFCAERRSEVVASRPDLDVTGQVTNYYIVLFAICSPPSQVQMKVCLWMTHCYDRRDCLERCGGR
jgi:hypothetical protein